VTSTPLDAAQPTSWMPVNCGVRHQLAEAERLLLKWATGVMYPLYLSPNRLVGIVEGYSEPPAGL